MDVGMLLLSPGPNHWPAPRRLENWEGRVGGVLRMAVPGKLTKQKEIVHGLWTAVFILSYSRFVASQGLKTAPAEKEALLAFRRALHDQDQLLSTWVQITDPCSDGWTGVFCVQEDTPTDADTNFLHVTEVRLINLIHGGELVPELGNLTALKYFDALGNSLTGTIPPELGKLTNLFSLTLSGNKITGKMPEELGNLVNLNRLQLDENQISGPVPSSFSKMVKLQHMHLNNNSLEGSIPPEIGVLPVLVHILLDNNKLTGSLPTEIANISELVILQLDNNNFEGGIPLEYGNMVKLRKLSCRNCGLSGNLTNLNRLLHLAVVDLSFNNFDGNIPVFATSNISSVDLSWNRLTGSIPEELQSATTLQLLKVSNNRLDGVIPKFVDVDYKSNIKVLDFQNNSFSFVSLPMVSTAVNELNFELRLYGNVEICQGLDAIVETSVICRPTMRETLGQSGTGAKPQGKPLLVKYRLKSPGFLFFTTAIYNYFIDYTATGLSIATKQVNILSWKWQPGPRLEMELMISPTQGEFNKSETARIEALFARWKVKNNTFYGPYELLGFSMWDRGTGLSRVEIAGIVIGSTAFVGLIVLGLLLLRTLKKRWRMSPAEKRRQRLMSKTPARSMIKITGVEAYTYKDMEKATDGFSEANQVGRGGYGKVFRGRLEDGLVVAIKVAEEAALQRNTEFYNEIELLSRCHHLNLVSLIGYCNDDEEQMLVYEFMEGGTLHDNLSPKNPQPLSFEQRLSIAIGSARGILYLHTEANPPVYHRDIKTANILLDDKKVAKVADFGLSRLAPVPDLEGIVMTHVSTVVKGTPGYLDPEYFLTHQLTNKSDVYSFGVVLMELFTGRPPIFEGKHIMREMMQASSTGELQKLIDPRMGQYSWEVAEPFAKLALSCVVSEPELRPPMKEVCSVLEGLMSIMSGGKGKSTSVPSLDLSSRDFLKSKEFSYEALKSGSAQNSPLQNPTGQFATVSLSGGHSVALGAEGVSRFVAIKQLRSFFSTRRVKVLSIEVSMKCARHQIQQLVTTMNSNYHEQGLFVKNRIQDLGSVLFYVKDIDHITGLVMIISCTT
ncbi:hypothetical protein R1flu_014686 [Riccia fluitans]|uniref:Protein kinase domain-containing protein n=1 Tax=Riccia fluitans TaxID=41844 RepID=A0ABD1YH66_9MARC